MTDEEYQEYKRLVDRYNYLVKQNNNLQAELEIGIQNCYVVAGNMETVGKNATRQVSYVSGEVTDANEVIEKLHRCIIDVTDRYFLFKNLSEASKMLTKYNDEYYTRFKHYNELRRITLGYVIGLDSYIISNESLRKRVEKAYLANTDYWLAYAISAVMLWASDEKEAAYRALNKALLMDAYKANVFFMLVNLRFGRTEVAKKWFASLLDKTDVNNMGDEWQYVLHTYLIGAISSDNEFREAVSHQFERMIDQTEATNADFSGRVIERSYRFAQTFIHVTDSEYITLRECSPQYQEMKKLLSDMEKIGVMAAYYNELYSMEEDKADNLSERIENVLYDLINSYDEQEFEVIKQIKLNEAILAAQGDTAIANQRFEEQYGSGRSSRTFAGLMIKWAFSEDYRETNVVIRRFAMQYLKDRIAKGVSSYFEERAASVKERYSVDIGNPGGRIPQCHIECNENEFDSSAAMVNSHYNKQKFRYVTTDKHFQIYVMLCIVAVVILCFGALAVHTAAFPVLLTLGIALGIFGGFLVWRRWVDVAGELGEKCRLAVVQLRKALEEMADWRKKITAEYSAACDLMDAINRF